MEKTLRKYLCLFILQNIIYGIGIRKRVQLILLISRYKSINK